MKIVDISEFYSPTGGGVRQYVDQKFAAASRHGHSLSVIAPGTEDRIETRAGGKIIWIKTPQLPLDPNYRMFWGKEAVFAAIDAEKPDILEGSSPWRGGWLAAKWPGNAVKMLFMHADPVAVYPQTLLAGKLSPKNIDMLFGWYWAYLRNLNSHFDGCVVAGSWLAKRFQRYGLKNLHVAPFGVETSRFHPGLRDEALRTEMLAQCGLGPDAALVLNVGRHHPEKRVPTLIEIVKLAQKDHKIGFFVVGDGFIHNTIKAKADTVPNVHLAGWVKDRELVARMLASADVILHGSSAETYGFAVAEGLCCGTPVVVPDSGGAADLAAPAYAETYTPGEAEDGARALSKILIRDRAVLSRAAVTAAQERIGDLDGHFDKLFALFESQLTKPIRLREPVICEDAYVSPEHV
ncbi:alpha-1,6-mannosyltransferase [Rhizomicrobium palustre]|uniref:Alpha-1,6-mannosyltransferase n=1 Tax=Rhizomicrobium palustre TaxID=189966 RepID=A0A846MVJ1_9PROT|nr:glycosyltransferase [Rhizomicrobium palustre]NIK87383.1 alpha-1,6-mannosyltransferase [Rhizomicrobium palustre]